LLPPRVHKTSSLLRYCHSCKPTDLMELISTGCIRQFMIGRGTSADSTNFASFLKHLRQAFDASGHTYGLSIALPSQYSYLKNFDLTAISQTVDWFNLMSFDLHGKWSLVGHPADDFISAHSNLSEIDSTLQLFWRNSIPPAKVVLGIGFYGRSRFISNLRYMPSPDDSQRSPLLIRHAHTLAVYTPLGDQRAGAQIQ
jgi:spore germination protein YaaH